MSYHLVLTGVESTFKSSLSNALGDYLSLEVVEEYARKFLEELHGSVDMINFPKDLLDQISDGQIKLQHDMGYYDPEVTSKIFDTDMLTLGVWSQDKFELFKQEYFNVPQHIIYLLCVPNNTFTPDPLRVDGYRRSELHEKYKNALQSISNVVIELHGLTFEERFKEATSALQQIGFTPLY